MIHKYLVNDWNFVLRPFCYPGLCWQGILISFPVQYLCIVYFHFFFCSVSVYCTFWFLFLFNICVLYIIQSTRHFDFFFCARSVYCMSYNCDTILKVFKILVWLFSYFLNESWICNIFGKQNFTIHLPFLLHVNCF